MPLPLVIYPRAWVELTTRVRVPTPGPDGTPFEDVITGIAPSKITLTKRPHHQADTCDVTINGSALPFDPRAINGIIIAVYMAAVPTTATPVKDNKYLRFVGYADKAPVKRGAKGPSVELKCRDLSSILRDCKPLPVKATPLYSDTLIDAVKRILTAAVAQPAAGGGTSSATASVSSTSDFADGDPTQAEDVIQIDDATSNGEATLTLGRVVSQRVATSAVPLKRDTTAWEAIEYCARLVNVLVSVELGFLLLRSPSDTFASTSAPVRTFYFGDDPVSGSFGDVLDVELDKNFIRNRKGIRVVTFDPTTRRALQSDYPPASQIPPKQRPPAPKAKKTKSTVGTGQPKPPDRDVLQIGSHGIHTQAELDAVAKRIYLEKSTQEIEGSITTKVWGGDANTQDVLDLANGDRIGIILDPKLEAELRNTSDKNAQIDFIVKRLGCSQSAAQALIDASTNPSSTNFYLKTITHDWSPKGASSKIDFYNLIEI